MKAKIINDNGKYYLATESYSCNGCCFLFEGSLSWVCLKPETLQCKDFTVYKKISEIERLILLEGEENEYEKNNKRS